MEEDEEEGEEEEEGELEVVEDAGVESAGVVVELLDVEDDDEEAGVPDEDEDEGVPDELELDEPVSELEELELAGEVEELEAGVVADGTPTINAIKHKAKSILEFIFFFSEVW